LKQSKKLIIILVVFVLFIVGSSFLYKGLSKNFASNQNLNIVKQDEPKTSSSTEKATTTEKQTDAKANQAIDFTVVDASKKDFKLSAAFGKPIILNFWASWCPPCKSEMPEFQKAYEKYGSDIQFIMVNLTDGERETIGSASAFVKKQGYTFPIYFDANQDAANAYQINSIPDTYFIDKDGKVAASVQGMLDAATLQKGIDLITGK
jgi:thiol-disulfide isomerase/thioredoxin